MRETWRYLLTSLALGLISYFGSEALFWSFPPVELDLPDFGMTIFAYVLACACALSAVSLTGVSGRAGLFLAGVLMGYIVEGIIVGTVYNDFPINLVWTSMAWHAALTGWIILGLMRYAAGCSVWRQITYMALAGLIVGSFAFYWPLERPVLPDPGLTALYILGCGALAVIGHLILDRIGTVPRPPRAVLLFIPVIALALWCAQTLFDPRPVRAAFPIVVGLTLWAMTRLGDRHKAVSFGGPYSLSRHLLMMILPLVATLIALIAVPAIGGYQVNLVALFGFGLIGLSAWLVYLFRAIRRPKR